MSRKEFRIFGFAFGRSDEPDPSGRFDELSKSTDGAGVQWRDLVQEGYRVPGDLFVGGLRMRYDWNWRVRELPRRLDEHPG
ncbi:MAG: hypothetical protein OEP52_05775 [Acidimicrobiia bacterium]|nr:hypothetical protein [Acidimicrobiia bacterium]